MKVLLVLLGGEVCWVRGRLGLHVNTSTTDSKRGFLDEIEQVHVSSSFDMSSFNMSSLVCLLLIFLLIQRLGGLNRFTGANFLCLGRWGVCTQSIPGRIHSTERSHIFSEGQLYQAMEAYGQTKIVTSGFQLEIIGWAFVRVIGDVLTTDISGGCPRCPICICYSTIIDMSQHSMNHLTLSEP